MDDYASDRTSDATHNSTAQDTIDLHHAHDSAAVDEHHDQHQRHVTPLQNSPTSPQDDSRNSHSLALVVSDLSEVPVKYEMRRDELEHLKNQLQGTHQEALATVIAQAAQMKSPGVPSSSTRLSAMPVTPTVNADVAEAKPTPGSRSVSASEPVKIPTDSYTWRKYGQKQVKRPEGSRSYYKCTYSTCDAKKIELSDQFYSITKIVYKGQHKHDPPNRVIIKENKILSAPESLKRKSISEPALKEHRSSAPIQIEQIHDSELKHRVKKSSSGIPDSVHPKKPKYIVHAAADIEISADGYRWRKYGQKMVKGNPQPRNYYKCTSAGCTVRKHIEKVVDGSSEVIITYNGVHDHDIPVPKKGQAPPSSLIITATSSASQSKRSRKYLSTTEAPKTHESAARTLLSVGFEIKQC